MLTEDTQEDFVLDLWIAVALQSLQAMGIRIGSCFSCSLGQLAVELVEESGQLAGNQGSVAG